MTGSRNLKKKKSCQDFCDYMITADGFLAAALSDGCGSAMFADLGARENVNAFLNFFRVYDLNNTETLSNKALGSDVVYYCAKAQENLSMRIGTSLNELSATLIGAVIFPKEIIIFHLGDGEVYAQKKNGEVFLASKPENIMGISNLTRFTTDKDAQKYIRVGRLNRDDISSFCMCSDGTLVKMSKNNKIKFISEIFKKAASDYKLSKLIDTQKVREYGDDCSMISVWLDK